MKILLLERSEKSARQSIGILKGVSVSTGICWTRSVEDALAALAAAREEPFTAVLFDLSTDRGGEESLISVATRSKSLRQAAVIAIAEGDTNHARATALARDAHGFLPKPLNPTRLQEMLSKRRLYWELSELPTKLDEYWRQRASATSAIREKETA